MQAADLRDGDHLSDPRWHYRADVGTILVERKMRAGALVIVDVRGQDATQMALVEDQDIIQTLAANRTDHEFDVSFCQGERGAVMTSAIPIASTRLQKYAPYDPSRSRSRWRGAVSHGNASVT